MLNAEGFLLIAGEPCSWDSETRALTNRGESLVALQLRQHRQGRRSAELVHGIRGWYVRAGSNLDDPSILAGVRSGELPGTVAAAVEWGRRWAELDPRNREFYVNRSILTKLVPLVERQRIGLP